MTDLASSLKAEISRIARKELRAETVFRKKSGAAQRKDIAALKRRVQALEQVVRRLSRGAGKAPESDATEAVEKRRFSAKGLGSQRKRLGLSAAEMGALLGTSAQTIYNWEQGKSRPRASYLPAIAALKTLGKKAAAEVVAGRAGQGQDPA